LNAAALSLLVSLALSAGGGGADEHLLAGARLFRDEQFAAALVEFRVAQKLGAPEARGYAGATLVKLERPEEAVEAFGGVDAVARDALLDYYRALACFDARLYLAADRILSDLGARSGPRIAEQAAKLRASIAAELAKEPSRGAVDWYLARCAGLRQAGRELLARAYCREAAGLGARRADRYGVAEAAAGSGRSAPVAGSRP